MITKYNIFVNEGVRDRMTPKSDKEIQQAYVNLVRSMKNSTVDKFPDEVQIEFEQMAELFGVSKESLYVVSDDSDKNYNIFDDYFESIADPNEKVIINGVENEYGESSGEWICYPRQKIARWSANDFDQPNVWTFSDEIFTHESIRVKITENPDNI